MYTPEEVMELLEEQERSVRNIFIQEFKENAAIADEFGMNDVRSTWMQAANVCDKLKIDARKGEV